MCLRGVSFCGRDRTRGSIFAKIDCRGAEGGGGSDLVCIRDGLTLPVSFLFTRTTRTLYDRRTQRPTALMSFAQRPRRAIHEFKRTAASNDQVAWKPCPLSCNLPRPSRPWRRLPHTLPSFLCETRARHIFVLTNKLPTVASLNFA